MWKQETSFWVLRSACQICVIYSHFKEQLFRRYRTKTFSDRNFLLVLSKKRHNFAQFSHFHVLTEGRLWWFQLIVFEGNTAEMVIYFHQNVPEQFHKQLLSFLCSCAYLNLPNHIWLWNIRTMALGVADLFLMHNGFWALQRILLVAYSLSCE